MILKFLSELTLIVLLTVCGISMLRVAMVKLEKNEKEFQKEVDEKLSEEKVHFE